MKKLLAILMALCLLTGFAMAEEVNWSDVEDSVAEMGIEGSFAEVAELGIGMFIPDVFSEVELTDEDVENGYLCYLTTEDQSAQVAVIYTNVEGISLEDFAAALPEAGATDIETVILNGIPAVTYEVPENDSMNVAMMTSEGYCIEFVFSPASDEGFNAVATLMGASIQPK